MKDWNDGTPGKKWNKTNVVVGLMPFTIIPIFHYSTLPVFDSIFARTNDACLPVGRDTVTMF
jgi:hypothetical protein